MTTVKIELGVQDQHYTQPRFDPGVCIEIRGDHSLVMDVLEYLEDFTSPAGQIKVK